MNIGRMLQFILLCRIDITRLDDYAVDNPALDKDPFVDPVVDAPDVP